MSQYFINIYKGVKTFLVGMQTTLRHFNNKEDLVATLQYPHEKWPIPERNIGFEHKDYNLIRSRLHVDIDDCIGCLQCEKACPVDCIKIDTIKPPKGSDVKFDFTTNNTEKKMLVSRFSIDMSECMYCNLCEYPCPEDCIYMVGGPNESKHEIDYEFSKYERDGLVYEFAFPTDNEMIEVGGDAYLQKRDDKINKLEEGSLLQGIVQAEIDAQKSKVVNSDSSSEDAVEEEKGLSLKIFNSVPDKVARGVAKKAFQFTRRNNMDYIAMAQYIEKAINDASKSSDEMAKAIKIVKDYIDEVVENQTIKKVISDNVILEDVNVDAVNDQTSVSKFDIKLLNAISDKMTRGIAKKAFLLAKKEGLGDSDKAKYITKAISDNKKMNSEIVAILNPFISSSDTPIKSNATDSTVVSSSAELNLFDIKVLNGIADRVARGTAKKIYMAGKRTSLSSEEVVDQIKFQLDADGKLLDEIVKLLGDQIDA